MSTVRLSGAVAAVDLIDALRAYGVRQADIAAVARVDPKTVYAWKLGATPRGDAYDRVDGIREVALALSDSLTERGVGQWLHARNRLLNGARPLDVLREGSLDRVLAAAASFADGAYV